MLSRLYAPKDLEVDGESGRAKAFLQPRHRGGGAALGCPPMDAAESQQVQHDRQQHNEETGQEQVVVVEKGEAVPPVRVRSFQTLLLDVSERGGKNTPTLNWL